METLVEAKRVISCLQRLVHDSALWIDLMSLRPAASTAIAKSAPSLIRRRLDFVPVILSLTHVRTFIVQ